MSQAQQVVTIVVIAIAALIGLAVIAPIAGVVVDSTAADEGLSALEPAPQQLTTVTGLGETEDPTISATTANSLYLDGGGSYVDDPTDKAVFENGSWTVGVVAEPSREGRITDTDTVSLFSAGNESVHLLLENGNWTARYETATGATAVAQAPANLDGRSVVAATFNASAGELQLVIDGSRVDTAQPDATTVPRDPAYSWVGSVDEFRVWDTALSPARHAAYADGPVRPQPTDAAARLMFNAQSPTTAYYAPGNATLVGDTTLVDGVAGPDLQRETDYVVSGDQVAVTNDGAVADAPVLIVDLRDAVGGSVASLIGGISSAFQLIPILLLVLMASLVIGTIARLRSQV